MDLHDLRLSLHALLDLSNQFLKNLAFGAVKIDSDPISTLAAAFPSQTDFYAGDYRQTFYDLLTEILQLLQGDPFLIENDLRGGVVVAVAAVDVFNFETVLAVEEKCFDRPDVIPLDLRVMVIFREIILNSQFLQITRFRRIVGNFLAHQDQGSGNNRRGQ